MLKKKLEKSRYRCISKYLILKHGIFTQLFLLNLFIKIIFLFKKMIIEIKAQIKLIKKNKRKKVTPYNAAHIKNII